MATKADIYLATAEKLGEAWSNSVGMQAAGEIADLAHELAEEYERIDFSFDRIAFLNVANPD